MSAANIDAAKAIYKLLPTDLFLVAVDRALQKKGFGYNDYTCIFGRDSEADPEEEFEGVQLIFIEEEVNISELEAYEGILKAIAEVSASHPELIARLENPSALVARKIETLRRVF
ncbi:hypothetical protein [Lysobacter enzymogenes]|uniref:hypothetical protein n=1 Tax=Lysobacter enzymogenes TaxID=69 RepID=UPI001A963464|nr:hypothetical protein [Lysobacter enzymogenes]QQP98183.1 hypothetical protein JHW38_09405 [Lysobacter enzymogenes]